MIGLVVKLVKGIGTRATGADQLHGQGSSFAQFNSVVKMPGAAARRT
ncbi:hypothetical protein [Sporomusa sphaeroides]|uniref:Uncharacterized protein n=1 Tax=Sporomusa sphaeroides DSM 2875 TaxID=1337886 RepID=A0A1U7M9Z2_9FIRM|nr:hypothetical protein [Sporomusa sphaeroides]OLS54344.1 hypothetical protein SPSPH_45900 [Sporomusa sphaeroides DSM 2875]CVK21573.1 hypothetical protein SSPH_04265 [Sporomusa sphaeroides DSM 2875]